MANMSQQMSTQKKAITSAMTQSQGKLAGSSGNLNAIVKPAAPAGSFQNMKNNLGAVGSFLGKVGSFTQSAFTPKGDVFNPVPPKVAQQAPVAPPAPQPLSAGARAGMQSVPAGSFRAPQSQPPAQPMMPPPSDFSPVTEGGVKLVKKPDGTYGLAGGTTPQYEEPAKFSMAMTDSAPPAPAPRAPAPQQSTQRDALLRQLMDSLAVSDEERSYSDKLAALQAQQANLNVSEQMGMNNLQNQPIAMPFITGQQAALQRSAAAQQQALGAQQVPLQSRLASLQADRARRGELAQFQYGAEQDYEKAQAAASRPIEVGGQLINPLTGEVVFAGTPKVADGFTLGEGQARYDAQGNLLANVDRRPETMTPYQQAQLGIEERKLDTTSTQQKQASINNASSATALVGDLLLDPALSGVVGPLSSRLPTVFGPSADFEAKVSQLKSLLTLNVLPQLKGSGALSDRDIELLSNAATSLNTRMSEAGFRKELQNIQQKLSGIGGGGLDLNDPETKEAVDKYGIDQVMKFKQSGKTNDLSTSQNGFDVKKVAESIGQFESGGNYKATGPATRSGDRAHGKYQIMGNNIPQWSKQALGRSITVDEFRNSPKLQDAIAQFKMQEYMNKYGNLEDVSSVWFSGQPLSKAGNKRDVIGTSVPNYVKNITAIYNRLG